MFCAILYLLSPAPARCISRAVTSCPGPKSHHHGPGRVRRQPRAPLVAPLVPVRGIGVAAHALHPPYVRENKGGRRPHRSSGSSSWSARPVPPPGCACPTVAITVSVVVVAPSKQMAPLRWHGASQRAAPMGRWLPAAIPGEQ